MLYNQIQLKNFFIEYKNLLWQHVIIVFEWKLSQDTFFLKWKDTTVPLFAKCSTIEIETCRVHNLKVRIVSAGASQWYATHKGRNDTYMNTYVRINDATHLWTL